MERRVLNVMSIRQCETLSRDYIVAFWPNCEKSAVRIIPLCM